MKTLDELTKVMTDLPCRFNDSGTTGATDTFPNVQDTTIGRACFQQGFPLENAKSSASGGRPILCSDMNKFGALATSELMCRELGQRHTFESAVSSATRGYGSGIALAYSESDVTGDVYLRTVESQVESNELNFNLYPKCIDAYLEAGGKDSDKIYWKTRNHVYGMSEGCLNAGGVDFSRKTELSGAETLAEDSLVVIGGYDYPVCGQADLVFPGDYISIGNMTATVTITESGSSAVTFTLPNRGKCGYIQEELIFNLYPLQLWLYLKEFCGDSNYVISFYAKKGTNVRVQMNGGAKSSTGEGVVADTAKYAIFAFPIQNGISYSASDEESSE